MRFIGIFPILVLFPTLVLASGYEKPSLFGARPAALGGVGSLAGNAAEGLAFNPGIISAGRPGWTLSLNFSPTSSELSGPFNNDNDAVTSSKQTSNSAGGMVAYNWNEKWGVALGRYAVGGGKTVYDDVVFRGFTEPLDFYSDIKLSEVALGLGYKINEMWSLGIAVRRLTYEASYTRPARAAFGLAVGAPEFRDLKDDSDGYRLGLQFRPNPALKTALMYRSPVDIRAEGFISGGKAITPFFTTAIAPGQARLITTLPQVYLAAVAYRWTPTWQTFFEASSTNYSTVRTVELETTSSDVGNRSILQNWKDQTLYKLGVEYTGFAMPLRAGISQTSQVTDEENSSPLIYPATALQSLSLGTGYRFKIFGNTAQVDFAIDKTTGQSQGGIGKPDDDYTVDARQGTYGIDIFASHLSFIYYFGQEQPGQQKQEPDLKSNSVKPST